MNTDRRGFTLIELLVVVAISGVLATAFIGLLIPQFANVMYLPNRQNVQSQGADLMDTIIDGDRFARGLRYATPSPRYAAVSPITAATSASLTYTYFDAPATLRTVTLTYDPVTLLVRRTVSGGPANQVIPVNMAANSDVDVIRTENNSAAALAFFRYFNIAGTEFVPAAATLGNIHRVQIAYRAQSGAGEIARYQGQMPFKSAVEIKDLRELSVTI